MAKRSREPKPPPDQARLPLDVPDKERYDPGAFRLGLPKAGQQVTGQPRQGKETSEAANQLRLPQFLPEAGKSHSIRHANREMPKVRVEANGTPDEGDRLSKALRILLNQEETT